jgi:hypothetical protein
LRNLLDNVPTAARAHQSWNSDALAAFDQDLGEGESNEQRPVQLAVASQRRGEMHRGRPIGPDPDCMRRLPFLLAHIKMVVARRAPPVHPRSGLARDKAAILPEILARTGAPPAMQAMDHRCRHAPGFENEARHAGGERTAFAGRSGDDCAVSILARRRARM